MTNHDGWGNCLMTVLLDLAFLDEIRERNEWKNLVLPKGHQRMVQAMVETYTNVRSRGSAKDGNRIGMDLVSGKGEGCIILLHGVPGVGKTSTAGNSTLISRIFHRGRYILTSSFSAECVAAHTNKPLYPITCGMYCRGHRRFTSSLTAEQVISVSLRKPSSPTWRGISNLPINGDVFSCLTRLMCFWPNAT